MAWYRTGTISVTNGSTAVTGAGTAWVGIVYIGDALVAPDGRNYEVASVNSNTSLTLATNYQGSTASAQAYAIQPTRALTAEWVAAAQAFQSQAQGWEDGPLDGLFGGGTVGAPGIGFAQQTNTGFFRPSASVLALSVNGTERARFTTSGMQLTGLLTGTAVTQSDTDTTAGRLLTTGAGAAQAFRRGNILGTVSQSGGVPTGAIIQRGSNANGEFVRYADGTQICWRRVDMPRASVNGFFATASFAAAFSTGPVVTLTYGNPVTYDNANMGPMRTGSISTTAVSITALRQAGAPSVEAGDILEDVNLIAVGRWF
jgi:hypothetical protein